jgi:hypothetical protein
MDCYAFFLHESGTSEAKAVSPTRGRSAQGDAMSLNLSYGGQIEPINDVMVLCKSAKVSHEFHQQLKNWIWASKKSIAERSTLWVTLPIKRIEMNLPEELDWAPGSWLSAWEANLPPSFPRHFDDKRLKEGTILLLSGQSEESCEEAGNGDFDKGTYKRGTYKCQTYTFDKYI